ncbi:hypothetical protein AOLI_G00168020 [Acnodon oligacanthus]
MKSVRWCLLPRGVTGPQRSSDSLAERLRIRTSPWLRGLTLVFHFGSICLCRFGVLPCSPAKQEQAGSMQ